MRNILAKVPQKLKQEVADDIRSIFYASSRDKALELASQFTEWWQKEIPSEVKCLENSPDSKLVSRNYQVISVYQTCILNNTTPPSPWHCPGVQIMERIVPSNDMSYSVPKCYRSEEMPTRISPVPTYRQ